MHVVWQVIPLLGISPRKQLKIDTNTELQRYWTLSFSESKTQSNDLQIGQVTNAIVTLRVILQTLKQCCRNVTTEM